MTIITGITGITEINPSLLLEARLAVDGPFVNAAKVSKEIKRYSNGKARMRAFVFVRDGKVCGYVEVVGIDDDFPTGAPSMTILKGFGHITRIGVVESERGKGLARELLDEAIRWLKSKGALGVWLDYLPSNESANRLYFRYGFSDIIEFKDLRNRQRRIAAKRF